MHGRILLVAAPADCSSQDDSSLVMTVCGVLMCFTTLSQRPLCSHAALNNVEGTLYQQVRA